MKEAARIYHVSKNGCDENDGSENAPFLTISAAALAAKEGDTILVHAGEYREWVSPAVSGVTYVAQEEGKAVIKGSEPWEEWRDEGNGIWHANIPNRIFGNTNPFAEEIFGDWFRPQGRTHHTGAVYHNGARLFEAKDKTALKETPHAWYAEVGEESTAVWASFGRYTPRTDIVEINVRKYCFFPQKTNVDRITVRGFRMCHAATNWAPPTALQEGMIGPHWSFGWVIENNIIHDSRCVGISLGKEASTGQNPATLIREKPGFNYQLEAVYKGLRAGWKKGIVGSHLVKNNTVYDCGQAGIVGHMGCAFSRIEQNHIYNINKKESFSGAEIACIKFHAGIDVVIEGNRLHDCAQHAVWLDWQNQGLRMSRNVCYRNGDDVMIEVCHGPCLIDNNLFLSDISLILMAQGTAFVNNFFAGRIGVSDVLARATPYHFPHETDVMGTEVIFGGDDRFYHNIFWGPARAKTAALAPSKEKIAEATGEETCSDNNFGLLEYRPYPLGAQAYRALLREKEKERGIGLLSTFRDVKQPVYAEGNFYALGANELFGEPNAVVCPDFDTAHALEETNDGVYFVINANETLCRARYAPVTTADLGKPRFPEAPYDNPDGTALSVNRDLSGNDRGEASNAGPFSRLSLGENRIKLA